MNAECKIILFSHGLGSSLYTFARAGIGYRRRSGKHAVSERFDQEEVFYMYGCYPGYGYGYPAAGGRTFALIVVLFILLIIVGAAFVGKC
jgi:uncharacterized protein (TIGR01732 family)